MNKLSNGVRYIIFFILLVIIIGAAYFMGVFKKANAPVATINGVNISIDDTIQTLLDNGLVLSSIGGGTIDCSEHTLGAMEYKYDGYEISINNPDGNNIDTNLVVTLYNPTNSKKTYNECKIAKFKYWADWYEEGDPAVTINDNNFKELSPEEALNAFEAMGVKVAEDDRTDFLNSGSGHFYKVQSGYKYTLETSSPYDDDGFPMDPVVSLVEIEKDVDISFK